MEKYIIGISRRKGKGLLDRHGNRDRRRHGMILGMMAGNMAMGIGIGVAMGIVVGAALQNGA